MTPSTHTTAAAGPVGPIRHALIVEDRPATAAAMQQLLTDTFTGIHIVSAGSVAQAMMRIAERVPDIALIDLGLPDGSGVEVIARLTEIDPDGQRIVTTIFADDVHLFPALRAGATGYLLKDQPPEQLARALAGMVNGIPPLSPAIARRLLQVFNPATEEPETRLSPRERDVLILIAKGCRLREAAEQLGVTVNTAAGYLKSVYQKLNVSSRAEATLEAVRRGLVGTSL